MFIRVLVQKICEIGSVGRQTTCLIVFYLAFRWLILVVWHHSVSLAKLFMHVQVQIFVRLAAQAGMQFQEMFFPIPEDTF